MALNSDGPTLPAGHLRQALDQLDQADVVLGPGEDGGYYLIGLRATPPAALLRDRLEHRAGAWRRRWPAPSRWG